MRKLGLKSYQRKAMLRKLATDLLYYGKIQTTVTRAKELRGVVEPLITLAVRERNNFTEEKVQTKVAKKDKYGKRIREEQNGKRVEVFETVEKTIQKDMPTRLNARRKLLSVLYPVTMPGAKKKQAKRIDMAKKMFDEVAPRYAERNGGYTRIIKLGPRKGDAAEMAIIELV